MSVLSSKHFHDESEAYKFVEAHLWADGRPCPFCGTIDNSVLLKGESTRIGVYKCRDCRKPFTVKVGTIFESSHIALHIWLQAMALMSSSKKGISANQLHRTLGITLRSAWFLAHRIRAAMDPLHDAQPTPTMGGAGKVIEVDEMFLTRSVKTKDRHKKPTLVVMALVERGGEVRSFPIDRADSDTLKMVVTSNVKKESRHYTDGWRGYHNNAMGLEGGHDSVDHSKGEYARGDVHTNTVEGYFSIFKRGMVGTYQHCGEQHLHRYLAEFDFRASNRVALGVNDEARTVKALKGVQGKRLTYRTTSRQVSEQ